MAPADVEPMTTHFGPANRTVTFFYILYIFFFRQFFVPIFRVAFGRAAGQIEARLKFGCGRGTQKAAKLQCGCRYWVATPKRFYKEGKHSADTFSPGR